MIDGEKLRVPVYDAPDKAQEQSARRQAISLVPLRREVIGVGMKTKVVKLLIVYPRGRDPHFVYYSAHGLSLPFSVARPTSRDVDQTRHWKAN